MCGHVWGRTAKAVEPACQEEKVLLRDTAGHAVTCRGCHRKGPGVLFLCMGGGWMPYGVQRLHTAQWGWEAAEGPCGVHACPGGGGGHTVGAGGTAWTAWASWCMWRLAARCTSGVMGLHMRGNTELYKVPQGTTERGGCGADGDGGPAVAWRCPGTGCFPPARMEQGACGVCNEQE